MRFSGHETFAIREGWLYKGLSALVRQPGLFEGPYPADQLGVGSNMAKSIRHWLVATGLARHIDDELKSRVKRIEPSEFGRVVLKSDPFFNKTGTWWFIHVNLVSSGSATASWEWFFGACAESVFSRTDVMEQFRRWTQHYAPKQPSAVTLQKDLNCLLATYAQRVPSDVLDPEEAMDCPLWDLGFITHFRGSATFRVNRSAKKVPVEAIGYSLAILDGADSGKGGFRRISFEDAATLKGRPGRTFLMGPSALYEAIGESAKMTPKPLLSIESQAGQRMIRYKNCEALDWVESYYARVRDENGASK